MSLFCALALCIALQTDSVATLQKQLAKTNTAEERIDALKQIGVLAETAESDELNVLRPAVLTCLDASEAAVRRQAAYCVASLRIFHPFRCPDRIVELLMDEDEDVRYAAGTACGTFDTYHATALPLLLRAFDSPHSHVREVIPFELKFFAYRAPEAMIALRRATKDEDPSVRNNACVALWHLTGDFDVVVPYWLACLETDAEGTASLYAVATASQFHAQTTVRPKELGVALAKQLLHKSPQIRSRAAHILGAMARDAEAKAVLRKLGIPDRLKQMLFDEDSGVQASAQAALAALNEE